MDSKLKSYLSKNKISYKLHSHEPTFTVEQSTLIKSEIPGEHTKCLFLKSSNGKFYLIALAAQKRLNTKSLKFALSEKKLNFASSEELKDYLGITPGNVSVFCLIHTFSKNVNLIVDSDLYNADTVNFHPNINSETLELSKSNFHKYLKTLKQNVKVLKL